MPFFSMVSTTERVCAGVGPKLSWLKPVIHGGVLRRAERAARGAMHGDTDEIIGLIRAFFGRLWRVRAKNLADVERLPFEHDVGGRECSHIAAGARECHPGSRNVGAGRSHESEIAILRSRRDVGNQIGPVKERRWKQGVAVGGVVAKAVGYEDAHVVGIETGLRGEDAVGGVGDKDGVIAGVERALLLDEIEKVGQLFEIGWNVGVIASEMNVVEFDVNDVLDFAARRIELALSGGVRSKYQKQ